MKLSIKGLALTAGMIWGAVVLLVGLGNLINGTYGAGFLTMIDSIYPGYHYGGGFFSVIVAMLYAFLDGGIAGAVFAWLYNKLA